MWYALDLGFNSISTLQLRKKSVERCLCTTDQQSLIFVDKETPGYTYPIEI